MEIRFINTPTTLRVDESIKEKFQATIEDNYKKAVESAQDQEYIDVFFVNEEDPDLERKELITKETEDSIDLLGVYIHQHPEHNNLNIIKICPEKIKKACDSFKEKNLEFSKQGLYPTLLVAVIIHELAHALMCISSEAKIDHLPWEWLTHRQQIEPTYDFKLTYIYQKSKTDWESDRHFIEESLANAFVLKQKTTPKELNFLKKFTAGQPDGYKQGDRWSGNLNSTIKTAQTWKSFKSRVDHDEWYFVFDEKNTPTKNLVDSLKTKNPKKSISSFDFLSEYDQHLINHIGTRNLRCEKDSDDWDKNLKTIFGVNWKLSPINTFTASQILSNYKNTGFDCRFNQLKSLTGVPVHINGDFNCSFNELESLDGMPTHINGNFICNNNQITTLKNINLHIKEVNGHIYLYDNQITAHILGIFFIKKCKGIKVYFYKKNKANNKFRKAAKILNKYIKKGRSGIIPCQLELNAVGLDDFAQI